MMTEKQVVKQDAASSLVRQFEQSFQDALPTHVTKEHYARALLTCFRKNPKLMKCTPKSLGAAIMLSAQLGLLPDINGQFYIIPYKDEAVGVIGYQGLVDLCYRSDMIEYIRAEVVYENDHFEYELGLNPKLVHKPKLDGDRGGLVAAYCTSRTKGASVPDPPTILTKEDIEKIKNASPGASSSYSPWNGDFEPEMWKKSVAKRHGKYLPKSSELNNALQFESWQAQRIKEIEAQVVDPLEPGRHDMSNKPEAVEESQDPPSPPLEGGDTPPPQPSGSLVDTASSMGFRDEEWLPNTCDEYKEIVGIMNDGRKRKRMLAAFEKVSQDTGMSIKNLKDVGHDDIELCRRIMGRHR